MVSHVLGTCFFWLGWAAAFTALAYKLRRMPRLLIPALAIMLGIAAFPFVYKPHNPTALDQINPAMVWEVPAMFVPGTQARDIGGMYFAFDDEAEPIGPGTRIAFMDRFFAEWPDTVVQALRQDLPPPPGSFSEMPAPHLAMHIAPSGTQLVADPISSWNWADQSIRLAGRFSASFNATFQNLDWFEDTFRFRRKVSIESKPDWWPTRGDVAKHHAFGNYVPGRPASYRVVSCTYLWDANPGMIGGFGPGNTVQVFTGPHELIIEDFSTRTPRRVGFRLLGVNTKSIGSMYVSHDGSVGYIPDHASNAVWLIPLYKAWEYLDSTPTTPDSSSHSAQSPTRPAPEDQGA